MPQAEALREISGRLAEMPADSGALGGLAHPKSNPELNLNPNSDPDPGPDPDLTLTLT